MQMQFDRRERTKQFILRVCLSTRILWRKTDGSKLATREVMTLEYLAHYRHVPQSIPLFRPAVPEGHNIPQQSARMLPFACGSPTTSDHIQSSLLFLFPTSV